MSLYAALKSMHPGAQIVLQDDGQGVYVKDFKCPHCNIDMPDIKSKEVTDLAVQIQDILPKVIEAKKYLQDTDYKVIKMIELSETLDISIKNKRQNARDDINKAKDLGLDI